LGPVHVVEEVEQHAMVEHENELDLKQCFKSSS
jgi:hypothetical protein